MSEEIKGDARAALNGKWNKHESKPLAFSQVTGN